MTDKPKVGGRKRPGGRTAAGRGNGAGHESQGDGWGGPAKGAGAGPEALIAGQDATKRDLSARRLENEQERLRILKDVMLNIATAPDVSPETRLNAAYKGVTLIEGAPVQRNINAQVDDIGRLNDIELRDELARLGRTGTEDSSGASAKGMSKKPGGVLQ